MQLQVMKTVKQQYQQPKTIISSMHIASNNLADIKIRYARFLENKYYMIYKNRIMHRNYSIITQAGT